MAGISLGRGGRCYYCSSPHANMSRFDGRIAETRLLGRQAVWKQVEQPSGERISALVLGLLHK